MVTLLKIVMDYNSSFVSKLWAIILTVFFLFSLSTYSSEKMG